MACIYKIRNLVNGKCYIGSTIRRKHIRKYEHFSDLRKNKHHSPYFQNAFNKYGESNFVFEVIENVQFSDNLSRKEKGIELVGREAYFIALLKPEYNVRKEITSIGKIGYSCSEKTKRKISESNLKRFEGKEVKQSTLDKRDRERRRKEGNLYPNRPKNKKSRKERRSEREAKKQLGTRKIISKMIIIDGKRKHSPEAIAKIKARSEMSDNKIRIREIQKIASRERIGKHHSKEDKIKAMSTKFGQHRKINIYDKQGCFINSCDFSLEASEITGVKRSNISNNLAGISKSAGGYIFKYSI